MGIPHPAGGPGGEGQDSGNGTGRHPRMSRGSNPGGPCGRHTSSSWSWWPAGRMPQGVPPEIALEEARGYSVTAGMADRTESVSRRAKAANGTTPLPPPSAAPMAQSMQAGLRTSTGTRAGHASPATVERKVHYNGWPAARGPHRGPRQAGGRAGHGRGRGRGDHGSRRITIRVPVDRFHEIFAKVIALGDVLDKSVTAEDITEAWSEVDLRLQTARATRERLMSILARTKDEKQKIQILKQIQRLTEEIDGLEARLQCSRPGRLLPHHRGGRAPSAMEDQPQEDEIAGFEWIRALSPFAATSPSRARPSGSTCPRIRARRRQAALRGESADGAVLWASRWRTSEGDAASGSRVRSRLAPSSRRRRSPRSARGRCSGWWIVRASPRWRHRGARGGRRSRAVRTSTSWRSRWWAASAGS